LPLAREANIISPLTKQNFSVKLSPITFVVPAVTSSLLRRRVMKKLFYIFAFAMLVCAPIQTFAQSYELIDLGVIPGNTHSIAMDVNNNGDVLCVSDQQLFIWTDGVILPI